MKEGEFHNPCSHRPRLDCLYFSAPKKPASGLARGLGNQLAWLWPYSEDRQKSPPAEALAFCSRKRRDPPHPLSQEKPHGRLSRQAQPGKWFVPLVPLLRKAFPLTPAHRLREDTHLFPVVSGESPTVGQLWAVIVAAP